MTRIKYRTILVIGDDHKDIVKKYSADTKVERHIKMKFDDAEKERKNHIKLIDNLLNDRRIFLTDTQRDIYEDMYRSLNKMTDFDYFREITEGCIYDEETGDAYTDYNENAYYQYERCQQHRLEVTGDEGDFSDPFILKDGTKSYSAHFNDIDWERIHKNKEQVKLNSRVWDLVVEDDEPLDEKEEKLKRRMENRQSYFLDNFDTKEDYIKHSTSLWYWGIATKDWYKEVNYKIDPMQWVTTFYDKFIKKLKKENPLITIYEVKALDYK